MMKNKKVVAGVFASMMLVFGVLFVQDVCLAAITAPTGTGLPGGTIAGAITKIIKILVAFVGGLSVLMIVVSGVMYVSSGGDSGRTETAKNILLYSIAGLVVALIAWVVVNTVITGLN